MVETIKGIIEKVHTAQTKTGKDTVGYFLNDVWINFFGKPKAEEGEEVIIEYEVSGNFKNGKDMKKTGVKIKQQTGATSKEQMYRLQWALKVATSNLPRGTNIEDLFAKAYEIINKFEMAINEKTIEAK